MREPVLTFNNFIIEHKQRLIFILKLVMSITLLIYLYNMLEFDKIIAALNEVNYFFLGTAFFLLIPNIFLQFIKWKIVCVNSLNEYNDKKIFTSIFLGFSGAVLTPMRLGEIAGRILGIGDKDPVKVTAAVFLDKIFTFIQILFIGFFAASIYSVVFLQIQVIHLAVSFLIFLLIIALVFYFFNKVKKQTVQLLHRIKFISKILNVFEEILSYKKRAAFYLFIASFFFYLIYIIQFALLVSAFTGKFLFLQYLWAASLVILIKAILPVSIGELGVRESASIFVLSLLGTHSSAAFNASIFLYLINIILPALPGSYLLIRKK